MIEKLTKKQERGIKEWQEHCLKIGYDISPINKDLTEKSWKKFYKILGKKEPVFWYCQSPLQAQIIINIFPEIEKLLQKEKGANIWDNIEANIRDNIEANIWDNIRDNIEANIRTNIRDNIRDNIEANIWDNIRDNIEANIRINIEANIRNNIWDNIRDNIRDNIEANIGANIEANIWDNIENNFKYVSTYSWCQHDISWIAYYKYFNEYGLLPTDENFKIFDIWYDLACSCGWCYTFENVVFICEKPSKLYLNNEKQVHKDGNMALEYSDGYGLYILNGVNVPKYLSITSESKLNMEFFKKEKNADIKAEFIRKYGIDRMIILGKQIDSYKNYKNNRWWIKSEYELIDMNSIFESINYAPYLKMKNQTTGTYHLEGVNPQCKTINDALIFRHNNRKNHITRLIK